MKGEKDFAGFDREKKILHLPILTYKWGEPSEVTVSISMWHYYTYRTGITFVEGSYNSEEDIDAAIKEGKKSIDFTCRSQDLVHFAVDLIKIRESYEKTGEIP